MEVCGTKLKSLFRIYYYNFQKYWYLAKLSTGNDTILREQFLHNIGRDFWETTSPSCSMGTGGGGTSEQFDCNSKLLSLLAGDFRLKESPALLVNIHMDWQTLTHNTWSFVASSLVLGAQPPHQLMACQTSEGTSLRSVKEIPGATHSPGEASYAR